MIIAIFGVWIGGFGLGWILREMWNERDEA